MLEHVPASWKVIQHVREKFSCRSCETIAQTPAPSHPIARGRARADAASPTSCSANTACICRSNRQSMTYRREGVDLDGSTLCDWVGRRVGNADAARRGDPRPRVRGRAHPR